jgi:hypothetical protein
VDRSRFLESVAAQLSAHKPEERWPGLVWVEMENLIQR